MEQTAVEWLQKKLIESGISFLSEEIEYINQAKEMEKEQRIMDYNAGHADGLCNHINDADNYINEQQYYNETYNTETI
jgi:hypothetical protein